MYSNLEYGGGSLRVGPLSMSSSAVAAYPTYAGALGTQVNVGATPITSVVAPLPVAVSGTVYSSGLSYQAPLPSYNQPVTLSGNPLGYSQYGLPSPILSGAVGVQELNPTHIEAENAYAQFTAKRDAQFVQDAYQAVNGPQDVIYEYVGPSGVVESVHVQEEITQNTYLEQIGGVTPPPNAQIISEIVVSDGQTAQEVQLPDGEIVSYVLPAGVTMEQFLQFTAMEGQELPVTLGTTYGDPYGQAAHQEPQGIAQKVEEKVENVAHQVASKFHEVEHAAEDAYHKVHEKVSDFFGMVGSLFHSGKHHGGTGPGGKGVGIGSTVDAWNSGIWQRGHVVTMDSSTVGVHLFTHPAGSVTDFPKDDVKMVDSYAPVVGSGVEVLYNGTWYTGLLIALPAPGGDGLYEVYCHGDDPEQRTMADENSIRPLLSPEEKQVVNGHMEGIHAAKRKEDEAKARAAKAAEAEAERKRQTKEAEAKKVEFKSKLEQWGLGSFFHKFEQDGYDTEESLAHMHDDEILAMGFRPGHVAKFYQAFPRGSEYVVSNANLRSTAPGVPFRTQKDMKYDSHQVAKFGSTVVGTEQLEGWLKVGKLYLPMEINGRRILYAKGTEPSETPEVRPPPKQEPESIMEKVESVVASAEEAAMEELHGFAHMLHFE